MTPVKKAIGLKDAKRLFDEAVNSPVNEAAKAPPEQRRTVKIVPTSVLHDHGTCPLFLVVPPASFTHEMLTEVVHAAPGVFVNKSVGIKDQDAPGESLWWRCHELKVEVVFRALIVAAQRAGWRLDAFAELEAVLSRPE